MWYTVEVWDGASLTVADTIDVKVRLDSLSLPADMTIPEGKYSIFSVPLDPSGESVEDLFFNEWGDYDPEKWRLFDYDNTFIELDGDGRILPGRSYWVRTRGFSPRIRLGEVETLPVSRAWAVPLAAGWNSISNPFLFNVAAGSMTRDDGTGLRYLYSYEDDLWLTQEFIEELKPWRGYLTWNGTVDSIFSDSVYIAPDEFTGVTGKRSAAGEGCVVLRVSGGNYHDGLVVFGYGYTGSHIGRDARDHMRPQLFRKPLEVSVSVSWDEGTPYLSDYRGPFGEGQDWRFTVRNTTGSSARFRFEGLQALPDGAHAVLDDR